MFRLILGLTTLLTLLSIQGCETPEGGSSLPWSQPESWEGSPAGMGMPY